MVKTVFVKGVGRVPKSRVVAFNKISARITSEIRTAEAQIRASKAIEKYQRRKKIPIVGGFLAKRALRKW